VGGVVLILAAMLEAGALRYALLRLGISSGAAFLLPGASLAGRYFNIPVAELPGRNIMSSQEIVYSGMRYVMPVTVHWPGTIIAVNVGGAVIPTVMSLYLLVRRAHWGRAIIAIAAVPFPGGPGPRPRGSPWRSSCRR
jgi:uncharacterized membrane protein